MGVRKSEFCKAKLFRTMMTIRHEQGTPHGNNRMNEEEFGRQVKECKST